MGPAGGASPMDAEQPPSPIQFTINVPAHVASKVTLTVKLEPRAGGEGGAVAGAQVPVKLALVGAASATITGECIQPTTRAKDQAAQPAEPQDQPPTDDAPTEASVAAASPAPAAAKPDGADAAACTLLTPAPAEASEAAAGHTRPIASSSREPTSSTPLFGISTDFSRRARAPPPRAPPPRALLPRRDNPAARDPAASKVVAHLVCCRAQAAAPRGGLDGARQHGLLALLALLRQPALALESKFHGRLD
jgi:hypothetical protein